MRNDIIYNHNLLSNPIARDYHFMNTIKVERLDHLGIVAGVINDLGIIETIDRCIEPDGQENVTTGEAVAAMIINGLGFSNRPLSLTPQFFENKPIELLFREGLCAEHFNRHKLGRSLDAVYQYGPDLLFSQIAVAGCEQEGIDCKCRSVDTSSFSLTGEYLKDTDEQAIEITYGYSKDHRPDLKQAILELVVSQDGGVPIISKAWNGNASDTVIFKERANALIEEFKNGEGSHILVADSKLYTEENASIINQLLFVTRIPGTLKLEQQVIDQALNEQQWNPLQAGYRYQKIDLCHYGFEQRWLVINSDAAYARAQKTVERAQQKEAEQIEKKLFHLQAKRFESPIDAREALAKIASTLHYSRIENEELTYRFRYQKRGRPTDDTPVDKVEWTIRASLQPDPDAIEASCRKKACFVLATNVPTEMLTDQEVFTTYKKQSSVEHGFRFLKDPVFFVSSLFVKKASRIQALLMIMTLALFVYSIAQRRLRQQLIADNETLPNQIKQPTSTPTLRWLFQVLEGINRVVITSIEGSKQVVIEGLTELRVKILKLFGSRVCQIYQIDTC